MDYFYVTWIGKNIENVKRSSNEKYVKSEYRRIRIYVQKLYLSKFIYSYNNIFISIAFLEKYIISALHKMFEFPSKSHFRVMQ